MLSYAVHLRKGCELDWADRRVRVVEDLGAQSRLLCLHSGKAWEESKDELELQFHVGRIVPAKGLTHISAGAARISVSDVAFLSKSDPTKNRTLLIKDVMEAMKARGIEKFTPTAEVELCLTEVLAEMKLPKARLTVWTLYRHEIEYRRSGYKIDSIVPDYQSRGRSKEKVEAIAADIRLHPITAEMLLLDLQHRLSNEQSSLEPRDVFRDHVRAVHAHNADRGSTPEVPTASRMTVRRWVEAKSSAFERDVRRMGRDAAQRKHRQTGAKVPARSILECMQCDDVDTRVYVIDPKTGRPIGSQTATFAVDQFSRALQGSGMTMSSVNTEIELRTVLDALHPKDATSSRLSKCRKPWLMCGMPALALFDNASYNHSKAAKMTLVHHQIDWGYTRPRTPTDKDAVEWLNGQFKANFCRRQRGAAVKKNSREECKKGINEAEMTPEEFEQEAMAWAIDEYMHTPGPTGKTPAQLWTEQLEFVDVHLPDPEHSFFAAYWKVETNRLNRASGGILRHGLRYQTQNNDLERLQRAVGNKELALRVNPDDLRALYVLDPTQAVWLLAECIDIDRFVFALTDAQLGVLQKNTSEARFGKRIGATWMRDAAPELMQKSLELSKSNSISDRTQGYLFRTLLEGSELLSSSGAILESPGTGAGSHNALNAELPTSIVLPSASKRTTMIDLWNEA